MVLPQTVVYTWLRALLIRRSDRFETFEVRGSDIFMTPYPGGKKSVSFRLEGHDPAKQSAKFVNADHDFPKALLYERVGEDRLQISLFGDGPSAAVTFDLGSGKKLRR